VITRQFEGVGKDASDFLKAFMWADEDYGKLARLYCRYPKSQRITLPMVERFLHEEYDAFHAFQTKETSK
jgi:hypothetical protein